MNSIKHVLGLLISVLLLSHSVRSDLFPLSIIHINDFHARFEPTDTAGGTCDEGEECIGGYARTVHTVRRLLEEQKAYNPVYFNAGDSFQGTLWYNVGRWNVTSEFLNILPADAMTLGNHEFDHKVEGLVPFLHAIESPMLVANIDASDEPDMEGLFQKSMIIERGGRKIGLIGVVLETFYDLADTGKLKFLNESEAITTEAQILKEQGANIIIVLTHCGYDVDKIIAQNAGADIDVIIGSHSHTFLYTGEVMPGPDKSRGDYPTEIIHEDTGHRVLIVQAAAYAKYVGNITVFFDDKGDVVSWEGAPIYMAKDIEEDEAVKNAMVPWKEVIDEMGNVVVGISRVTLEKWPCSSQECNLGNFFADAMVHSFIDISPYDRTPWSNVSIGLVNTGALRVPLYKGNLTYAHVIAMSPFENTLVAFNLQGKYLLDVLEFSVNQVNVSNGIHSSSVMLQVSGLRITYNFTKPMGERVHDVQVKCTDCDFPLFEPLDEDKVYRIVTPDYIVNGGDGFYILPAKGTDFEPHKTDIEALIDYMNATQPITTANEDKSVLLALSPWKEVIDQIGSEVIGETAVKLAKFECSSSECNLGNFFTDAMVHAFVQSSPYTDPNWSSAAIALTTQGNFRVPLEKGTLTYNHLYTMCPFENKFIALSMYGRHLVEVLELGVSTMNSSLQTPTSSRFLQVSGLKVTYNITNSPGHRVDNVMVRCNRCNLPIYEKLDPDTIYRIVVSDYLAEGNNGFGIIKENAFNVEIGPKDLDAVRGYMAVISPVVAVLEGRLRIVK